MRYIRVPEANIRTMEPLSEKAKERVVGFGTAEEFPVDFGLTQSRYFIILLTIMMMERTSRQTTTKDILRKMLRLEDQAIRA